jgi:hypothetical protein
MLDKISRYEIRWIKHVYRLKEKLTSEVEEPRENSACSVLAVTGW